MNAPRKFTDLDLHILVAAFEKMSQLATMYEDAGISTPMEQYVSINHSDVNVYDIIERNGCAQLSTSAIDKQRFDDALELAVHTMVEFTVDTKSGKKSTSTPLFPYITNAKNEVAWQNEPNFIIRLNKQGRLEFEFFNELRDFINMDVDGNIKTTMMVGGSEIWYM
jgi:hypothetical protein